VTGAGTKEALGRTLCWVAATSVLIAAVTPKIMIGQTPIYASEPLLALAPILIFLRQPQALREIEFSSATGLVVVFYIFVLLGSIITATITAEYSVSSFLLLIKRVLYHLVLLVFAENGARLLGLRLDAEVDRFFRRLLVFALIPLFFSMAELSIFAALGVSVPTTNVSDFADSYSPTLFAVGFTGRAIGPDGLYLVGSSSINYGILNGALSVIALLYREKTGQWRWLLCALLYAAGAVLTMSSTALIVLAAGWITVFVRRGNYVLRGLTILLGGTLFVIIAANLPIDRDRYFAIGDLISTFQGVLYGTDDASNVDLRVETFRRAFAGIDRYPHVIWTGAGISDYVARVMNANDPLIESFAIDALLNAGVLGFSALVLSFALLGKAVARAIHAGGAVTIAATFAACFAPGLLFSNTISGNSVQSEFVGGLLFFALGICSGVARRGPQALKETFGKMKVEAR
jgi:hypothetical protein